MFNIGDRVKATDQHYPHRRGDTGEITEVRNYGFRVKWDSDGLDMYAKGSEITLIKQETEPMTEKLEVHCPKWVREYIENARYIDGAYSGGREHYGAFHCGRIMIQDYFGASFDAACEPFHKNNKITFVESDNYKVFKLGGKTQL